MGWVKAAPVLPHLCYMCILFLLLRCLLLSCDEGPKQKDVPVRTMETNATAFGFHSYSLFSTSTELQKWEDVAWDRVRRHCISHLLHHDWSLLINILILINDSWSRLVCNHEWTRQTTSTAGTYWLLAGAPFSTRTPQTSGWSSPGEDYAPRVSAASCRSSVPISLPPAEKSEQTRHLPTAKRLCEKGKHSLRRPPTAKSCLECRCRGLPPRGWERPGWKYRLYGLYSGEMLRKVSVERNTKNKILNDFWFRSTFRTCKQWYVPFLGLALPVWASSGIHNTFPVLCCQHSTAKTLN